MGRAPIQRCVKIPPNRAGGNVEFEHIVEGAEGGAPVIFQEVVHSVGTGEAGCDEQLVTLETEWTITRMPHGRR